MTYMSQPTVNWHSYVRATWSISSLALPNSNCALTSYPKTRWRGIAYATVSVFIDLLPPLVHLSWCLIHLHSTRASQNYDVSASSFTWAHVPDARADDGTQAPRVCLHEGEEDMVSHATPFQEFLALSKQCARTVCAPPSILYQIHSTHRLIHLRYQVEKRHHQARLESVTSAEQQKLTFEHIVWKTNGVAVGPLEYCGNALVLRSTGGNGKRGGGKKQCVHSSESLLSNTYQYILMTVWCMVGWTSISLVRNDPALPTRYRRRERLGINRIRKGYDRKGSAKRPHRNVLSDTDNGDTDSDDNGSEDDSVGPFSKCTRLEGVRPVKKRRVSAEEQVRLAGQALPAEVLASGRRLRVRRPHGSPVVHWFFDILGLDGKKHPPPPYIRLLHL